MKRFNDPVKYLTGFPVLVGGIHFAHFEHGGHCDHMVRFQGCLYTIPGVFRIIDHRLPFRSRRDHLFGFQMLSGIVRRIHSALAGIQNQDLLIFFEFTGYDVSVVFQEGQPLLHHIPLFGAGLLRPDLFRILPDLFVCKSRVRVLQQSMPRFQCQNSAHRLINPVSGYFSLFRHFNNGIHNVFKFLQGTGIVNRTGHEKHIDSGVDSHLIDVILSKMLCDRLHFKSIRHNDPVEIHFVTKNVRKNLSGQCCGDHHFFPGLLGDIGLIIQVGILDMGSHNHFRTGFDPHPERDQLSLIELFQCFLHSGKSGVAVRTGISMTGKMFQDGDRTALGHSLEKRCPVIRDDFGVIRKGAHPYDRIIGIIIDVHDYAEIGVNGEQ